MPEDLNPILAEIDAQGAAERAVEGVGSLTEARMAIQGALDLLDPPMGLAEHVSRAAMRDIVGVTTEEEELVPTPAEEDWETHLFESIAIAWMGWLQGRRNIVEETAKRLRLQARSHQGASGAVHQMALFFWLDAIEQRLEEHDEEAKRLWRRALEVGSSYGTESHPVILWTYLATFFPRGAQSLPALGSQADLTSGG